MLTFEPASGFVLYKKSIIYEVIPNRVQLEAVSTYDNNPKRSINTNLAKSCQYLTSISVVWSFRNFAQSVIVTLPCTAKLWKDKATEKNV